MRLISITFITILFSSLLFFGCGGNSSKNAPVEEPEISVPDTGFTGIKKYPNRDGSIAREVSYKNGVRHGETKTYLKGALYQTIPYENDVRNGIAKRYYTEGQVYKETPYVNDTIDGIIIIYYRNGSVTSKMGYSKGKQTKYLEEFNKNGTKYTDYPKIETSVTDEYATKGTYRIDISLSKPDQNVIFYRGSLVNNTVDTAALKELKVTDGKAVITLKKTTESTTDTVGIIARVLTPYRNRYVTSATVKLPYKDLK
ncbi:MAG: hypothetical protein J6X92_05995 [Bacteroidales bacterium]|nr:hypothetical protein [Bacteroidales bacterium]